MITRSTRIAAILLTLLLTSAAQAKEGLGEIFGALIGSAVGKTAGKAFVDPQTAEAALRKMTEQVNARMPMTVDKDTRLDNLLAGPGARFSYNYTIITATSREIDRTYLMNHLQSKVKAGVCSSPDMQVFFKNKVTVGYSYRASDGVFVGKIDITPRDCGYAT
jgi:hypothetical protein